MQKMTWNDWNPYRGVAVWTIITALVICLVIAIFYGHRVARKRNYAVGIWRGLLAGLLLFYLFTVFCATLLGRELFSNGAEFQGQLFWTLQEAIETGNWIYWYYISGNVILFVPLGFLLSAIMIGKGKGVRAVLCCFLLSCLIERIQYVTGTGLCELDDVMHNSLGGAIGALACWGVRRYNSSI